jgi:transcriptional regulator with XRE-family HTH domain
MRQEKGLSLSDVSRLSGLSLNKLDLLESGQHMPTLPQLYVLAAIFETGSLITLMEGI